MNDFELKVISKFLDKVEDYLENPNNGASRMNDGETAFYIDGYYYTILNGIILPAFYLDGNIYSIQPTLRGIVDLIKLVRRVKRITRLAHNRMMDDKLERIDKIINGSYK